MAGIIGFIKKLTGGDDTTIESDKQEDTWSETKESVNVKKAEYDSMQRELFEKTEIIKRLTKENEENRTILNEYGTAFEIFTQHGSKADGILERNKRAVNELERVKSSEERLRTHVQALKRDLLISENRLEEAVAGRQQVIETMQDEAERQRMEIKTKNEKINELSYATSQARIEMMKMEEKIIELIAICRELLRGYH